LISARNANSCTPSDRYCRAIHDFP
jgi:hypothetical protein